MKKKLFMVSNYNNHIPQFKKESDSLNLELMSSILSVNFEVIIILLDDLIDNIIKNKININQSFFFFSSSQIEEYKLAICDVALEIERRNGILIPSYEFYIAHDNKFYQELYKNRCNVKTPKSQLFTNSNFIGYYEQPIVSKSSRGFASRSVLLAKNKSEYRKSILANMRNYIDLENSFVEKIKSLIKSKVLYRGLYPNKIGRVVAQDFLPGLKFDWKVLVFGNSVFALKRYTKKNDFRASGSGMFDFSDIPSDELIKFAVDVRKRLDTPFISLDIAELDCGSFSVIEYQSVHFGLSTALNSKHHFKVNNNNVEMIKGNISNVEFYFCQSFMEFIEV